MSIEIADPRVFAAARGSVHEALIRLAEASLEASSASRGDEIGLTLARALADHLIAGDSLLLTELFPAAPSAAVGRQLWRALIDAWRIASAPAQGDGVVATLFALPVVVVVGLDGRRRAACPPLRSAASSTTRRPRPPCCASIARSAAT